MTLLPDSCICQYSKNSLFNTLNNFVIIFSKWQVVILIYQIESNLNHYLISVYSQLLTKCWRGILIINLNFILANYTNIVPKFCYLSVLNNIDFNTLFKTNNKLLGILKPGKSTPLENKTKIYKLNYKYCNCFYIGQTGRGFMKCFREHTPIKWTNCNFEKSNYAWHLSTHNHKLFRFQIQPITVTCVWERPSNKCLGEVRNV